MTVSRWENDVQSPTDYQSGLIRQFGKAAKNEHVANDIGTIIVTGGAIAGLLFLLKSAAEQ